jgi:hypothetical protein
MAAGLGLAGDRTAVSHPGGTVGFEFNDQGPLVAPSGPPVPPLGLRPCGAAGRTRLSGFGAELFGMPQHDDNRSGTSSDPGIG